MPMAKQSYKRIPASAPASASTPAPVSTEAPASSPPKSKPMTALGASAAACLSSSQSFPMSPSSSSPPPLTNSNNNTKTTTNTSSITSSNNISIQQKLSNKIHALFFIYLSYITIKYTNTISILFTSTEIIRPLLYIAIVLLAMNSILFLYLGVYIPKIKGLDVSKLNNNNNNNNHDKSSIKTNSELWSIYCPRVIPIMTFNGIVCSFVLVRCFWPVWGFVTPFILGIEFFGLLFTSHFIPWC